MNALGLHSLCIPQVGGGGRGRIFSTEGRDLLAKRRCCQKILYDLGHIKKVYPFKKYPLLPPAVYIMNTA